MDGWKNPESTNKTRPKASLLVLQVAAEEKQFFA